jgi:hypothetical protein
VTTLADALRLHKVAAAARHASDVSGAWRDVVYAARCAERFGGAVRSLGDDEVAELARLVGAARTDSRRDVR